MQLAEAGSAGREKLRARQRLVADEAPARLHAPRRIPPAAGAPSSSPLSPPPRSSSLLPPPPPPPPLPPPRPVLRPGGGGPGRAGGGARPARGLPGVVVSPRARPGGNRAWASLAVSAPCRRDANSGCFPARSR